MAQSYWLIITITIAAVTVGYGTNFENFEELDFHGEDFSLTTDQNHREGKICK